MDLIIFQCEFYIIEDTISKWAWAKHYLQDCKYAQRRHRSACTSTQANQSLGSLTEGAFGSLATYRVPCKD